jgi:hypothetical protein
MYLQNRDEERDARERKKKSEERVLGEIEKKVILNKKIKVKNIILMI